MRRMILRSSVVVAALVLSACGSAEKESVTKSTSDEPAPKGGHSHDELFWQMKDIDFEGHVISLGHHGIHPHAGEAMEPAVMVTKDGEPVAKAEVFVSLLDSSRKEVLSKEVPTVFEPTTDEEPAHYAQGEVNVPTGVATVTIHYRAVLPGVEQEFSKDVSVKVFSH